MRDTARIRANASGFLLEFLAGFQNISRTLKTSDVFESVCPGHALAILCGYDAADLKATVSSTLVESSGAFVKLRSAVQVRWVDLYACRWRES